jgi:hypothetical protein
MIKFIDIKKKFKISHNLYKEHILQYLFLLKKYWTKIYKKDSFDLLIKLYLNSDPPGKMSVFLDKL